MAPPRSAHGAALCLLLFAGLPVACSFRTPTSPPATVITAGAWERRADAPVPLTEVAVAAHDGRIWVAGGLRGDGTGSVDVFVYDPATDAWSEGPDLPEAVHHSTLVSDGESLRLLGGYAGSTFDTPTTAVRRLDETASSWVDDPPLPEPRAAGAAAWDGSRIVYAGGVEPGAVSGSVFALEDGAWRQVARLAKPREHLAATSDGEGSVFVVGGRVGGLDANLATADLVRGTTAETIGDLPTPRGGVAAFWWTTLEACLVGGESPGGTNPQVECIDVDGDVAVLPGLRRPRHGLGAAVVDGTAYVLLGGDQPGLFVSPTVESLELP
jgi:non-specific serine/threonine protein kinase